MPPRAGRTAQRPLSRHLAASTALGTSHRSSTAPSTREPGPPLSPRCAGREVRRGRHQHPVRAGRAQARPGCCPGSSALPRGQHGRPGGGAGAGATLWSCCDVLHGAWGRGRGRAQTSPPPHSDNSPACRAASHPITQEGGQRAGQMPWGGERSGPAERLLQLLAGRGVPGAGKGVAEEGRERRERAAAAAAHVKGTQRHQTHKCRQAHCAPGARAVRGKELAALRPHLALALWAEAPAGLAPT